MRKNIISISVITLMVLSSQTLFSDTWPMKQKDQFHTGRSDLVVPANRANSTFFDVFLWQVPAPDSPGHGRVGGSSMSFYDGAGPDGRDIVLGSYHWPKGIMGLDRHTGETFWQGNPDGGEIIGERTPAFNQDGSVIYINNDYADSGAVLMAFLSVDGPATFWGNAGDTARDNFLYGSPIICNDTGIIYANGWYDRPYGAVDGGFGIYQIWEGAFPLGTVYSEPSIFAVEEFYHLIAATGRYEYLLVTGSDGIEQWSYYLPDGTDASPTIDPANGNIYLSCGWTNIYIAGFDINGNQLWDEPYFQVFDTAENTLAPQHAIASGCLSHDGAVYYFQTVAEDGSGKLYAINTSDGSVRWIYDTESKGWEGHYSSPIITADNIIIVGNNDNGRYFAIADNGQDDAVLLDTFDVSDNTEGIQARASATTDSSGIVYLPLCTTWTTSNGNDDIPDYNIQNLFCAFDMSEDASAQIAPPGKQRAFAGNNQVTLKWVPANDTSGTFAYYAIYRDEQPFDNVDGMEPIDTVADIAQNQWTDLTALNDTAYYYAITAVGSNGSEKKAINAIGPRTPFDETDLQVVNISRTPFYPRYDAAYTSTLVTESDTGFGPYWVSACTGLNSGQNDQTQRFPEIGDTVTFTANCRNRGSNTIDQTVNYSWTFNDIVIAGESVAITLAPGEIWQISLPLTWDNISSLLRFEVDISDSRPANNSLAIDTKSVGYLTYIDSSFLEIFREEWTANHYGSTTNDLIDWLNMHTARFNELFAEAGCDKRVHYDVLQVIDDLDPDPADPATINFAIFPFRYHWDTDGDPRTSGYYHNDDDIDYGLLHEMGHQLGMIDVYQFNLDGGSNFVNGAGYSAHADLMTGCSPFINEFHALAMQSWLDTPHGMYGQFLYNLPETIQLRLLGRDGAPLTNASVNIYQMCERDGIGRVITDQIKASGSTSSEGLFTLPNVPIDPNIVPVSPSGEQLNANPFGYVHVVGTNGLLLFEVEYNGEKDYCWLDITQANVAFWKGDTVNAIFDRQLAIGGAHLAVMPRDLAENNTGDWLGWAEQASGTISLDTENYRAGAGSIQFDTDGGFDTFIRYPASYQADWDLTGAEILHIWFYAENDTCCGFQENSPWIRLRDAQGNYLEYRWYQNGYPADFLNQCNYSWKEAIIPLAGPFNANGWNRSESGSTDLASISSIEIHADTWESGFRLWVDDIYFDWAEFRYCDVSTDGTIDLADLELLASFWLAEGLSYPQTLGTDLNADGIVNIADFAQIAVSWMND